MSVGPPDFGGVTITVGEMQRLVVPPQDMKDLAEYVRKIFRLTSRLVSQVTYKPVVSIFFLVPEEVDEQSLASAVASEFTALGYELRYDRQNVPDLAYPDSKKGWARLVEKYPPTRRSRR